MKNNTVLWIVQGLLAVLFLFAGGSKLVMSAAQMTEQAKAVGGWQPPLAFIRFIGVCEVLGGFGVVVPWLTGIRSGLTPLAAGGLLIIMIGATVANLTTTVPALAIFTAILGLMAALVAYGRWLAPARS
jgi:DoxX-like protein